MSTSDIEAPDGHDAASGDAVEADASGSSGDHPAESPPGDPFIAFGEWTAPADDADYADL